jgi:hypothetical protein
MGSGGGSYWAPTETTDELTRQAVDNDQRSNYEQSASDYLQGLLADSTQRDPEAVQSHIDSIRTALEKEIEGSIPLNYGGSVRKRTYVDGLSDIDLLAILNRSELSDKSPEQVRQYFEERLRERFPNSHISAGKLAVTIEFGDGTVIQILPAIKTPTGTRISNQEGSGWSNVVKPEAFAQELNDVNRATGGKVVPVIKLFKSLNQQLPEDAQLSGYHIEALAVKAFKNYSGSTNPKDMLMHLSNTASEAALKPMEDVTGQSAYVDERFGPENSLGRQKVSLALKRISAQMKTADSRASTDEWQMIFGE